jgi:hypothetical protein
MAMQIVLHFLKCLEDEECHLAWKMQTSLWPGRCRLPFGLPQHEQWALTVRGGQTTQGWELVSYFLDCLHPTGILRT